MSKTKQKFNHAKKGDYLVIRSPSKVIRGERFDVSAHLVQIERYNEESPYFLILPNTTGFHFEPLKKEREGRFLVPTVTQEYYCEHNPRRIAPVEYLSFPDVEITYNPKDMVVVSDNLEDIVRVFAEDSKLACYEALVRSMLRPKRAG